MDKLRVRCLSGAFAFVIELNPDAIIINPTEVPYVDKEFYKAFQEAYRVYEAYRCIRELIIFRESCDLLNYDEDRLLYLYDSMVHLLRQTQLSLNEKAHKVALEALSKTSAAIFSRNIDCSEWNSYVIEHYLVQRKGYVYLLQSPSGHYKIGRSSNPEKRLKTFGIQLPFEVKYICLLEAFDMVELERAFHDYFSSKRINGEWFNLTDDDVAWFKGLVI